MLDQTLIEQLKGIFSELKSEYKFKIRIADAHSSRKDLVELMNEVASSSPKFSVEVESGDDIELQILKDGKENGIVFRAVPTGHEFTSLLLAILNLDGKGKNLPDAVIADRIRRIKGEVKIKSYISLSCTNCPDVVQSINIFAINNPAIRHEIIDGATHQDEVSKLGVQAVPTVYADDQLLVVGKASLTEILDKLETIAGVDESMPREKIVKDFDVVVLGGGPAGSAAAIYSARKGFKVAVVAERMGGQILDTVDIENMISVPKTTGKLLAEHMGEHIGNYPIEVFDKRKVVEIKVVDGQKQLTTSFGEQFNADALIVATGASWRKLNVPGEADYIGRGVAFCTHCDGPFYKGRRVVVVGGGNSGLEAALDLSNIAAEVTVVEFLTELKGDRVLQDKLKACPNVKIILNAQSTEVKGNGTKVVALSYKDRATEELHDIECDGIFVQIGLMPNSSLMKEVVAVTPRGEIQIDATCRTNVPGIYAAGDVSTVPYKQIVIAMGEGAKSALSAFEDSLKNALK